MYLNKINRNIYNKLEYHLCVYEKAELKYKYNFQIIFHGVIFIKQQIIKWVLVFKLGLFFLLSDIKIFLNLFLQHTLEGHMGFINFVKIRSGKIVQHLAKLV